MRQLIIYLNDFILVLPNDPEQAKLYRDREGYSENQNC